MNQCGLYMRAAAISQYQGIDLHMQNNVSIGAASFTHHNAEWVAPMVNRTTVQCNDSIDVVSASSSAYPNVPNIRSNNNASHRRKRSVHYFRRKQEVGLTSFCESCAFKLLQYIYINICRSMMQGRKDGGCVIYGALTP